MTTELLTPYKCAGIVNAELARLGVEKKLPPQMFYTYVNKGMITSTTVAPTTEGGKPKKLVSQVDLMKWFNGYFAKLTKVEPEVQEETAASLTDDEVDENQMTIEDLITEEA